MRLFRTVLPLAISLCLSLSLRPSGSQAQVPAPAPAVLDFSGLIYSNFARRTDSTTKAANGGNAGSKFDVERVYLNFRMPAGDRASIRVTTDIFNGDQSGASYYRGWTLRVKYAYLQWNVANDLAGVKGLNATTRFGMLHNVVIDHIETYWTRYLSQTDVERTAGMFSSADLGAALLLTLPGKKGEIYSNIVNGPGYSVAESDRFKDVAMRLTLTPFANGTAFGAWGKTLAITPWIYSGKTASKFQNGGAGQVGNVTGGLKRNRYGVFFGTRDPRLTLGVGYAQRTETVEAGANTAASPRTVSDVTGRVTSGFVVLRPGAFGNPTSRAARWGVLARIDDFKPDVDADASQQFSIFSLFWEPTSKVTLSLDSQALSRKNGSAVGETKGLFLHVQALF